MGEATSVEADIIIVGGGSAGCVLASRLSERPDVRVLLLEAGIDTTVADDHPALASPYPGKAYSNPDYTWKGLSATYPWSGSNRPEGKATNYEQARLLGGGSSINGVGANRGAPQDYDDWEATGLPGWGWDDCLPYFKKLERDIDFPDDPLHGDSGPFPVRRRGEEIWTPFTKAVMAASEAQGIGFLADQNGAWEDGMFEMAVNMDESKRRVSCAWAYLTPEVRRRPNLEIRTETTVSEILFDGPSATGVVAERGGQRERLTAQRIIISTGALATPAVLMRAGIGPAAHLADCGIEVRANLPGVGQNLMEHPSAGLVLFLKPEARQTGTPDYHIPIGHRFSSGLEGCPPGDMHMTVISRAAWHRVGAQLGGMFSWVNKSYSKGQILLDPANPSAYPRIDFRMLSDRRDLVRLANALERSILLAADPAIAKVAAGVYAGGMSEQGKKYAAPTAWNGVATSLAALGLDVIGKLREKAFPYMLANFRDPAELLADRDALESYVAEVVGGVWHPSCSCRMGPEGDSMAVVDGMGKVRGVEGLYLCDASIMPSVPCANTNVPTMMMAEKIADAHKAQL